MELRHFKAKYFALFQPESDQVVHTFQFYDIDWKFIEITELHSLTERSVEHEKVGDFMYSKLIRSKKHKISTAGCEVVLRKDENKFFNADLHDVVFRSHSGARNKKHLSVRKSSFIKIDDQNYISEGIIYFSIKLGAPASVGIEKNKVPMPKWFVSIPDLIFNRKPKVLASENQIDPAIGLGTSFEDVHKIISNAGRTSPTNEGQDGSFFGGCLNGIIRLFGILFGTFLILYGLGILVNLFSGSGKEESKLVVKDDGSIQQDPPRLNPKQDTLAPMPWDYLIRHKIKWSDFINNSYLAMYSTSTKEFSDSKRLHQGFANPQGLTNEEYYGSVYSEFSSHDINKFDSLTNYFSNERKVKNMDADQTAEMVISYIQEIPYYLVHDGSCQEAASQSSFMSEYHQSRKPCLPEIIAGVQSPYEFIHNLKGDCDTRSLLGYTILTKLGIPASVWISQAYGHSILGVGIGQRGPYSKTYNGIRYSPVELTAKGYRLGMISPEQGDMGNWSIVLSNH